MIIRERSCKLVSKLFYSLASTVADERQLVLIGVHTDPDTTVEEMEALVDVHAAVAQLWETNDIIILGNMHADCTYVNETDLGELTLRTDLQFSWLLGDDADTTVTSSTDCAYDRCAQGRSQGGGRRHAPNRRWGEFFNGK